MRPDPTHETRASPEPAMRCACLLFSTLMLSVACGVPGEPPPPDPPTDEPGSAYIFDPTVVRTYEFILEEADWQRLQATARDEIYVPATLRFEGVDYPGLGLRYKGAIGSLYNQGPVGDLRPCFDGGGVRIVSNCPKLGMKASFNEYSPDWRWHGLKKLQFHAMGNDASMMVEHLSYRLFRDAGVYAPRTAYVRLVINGEFQGLYILPEQIDGRFTRERFPDGGKGNLYKEVWPVHFTERPYIEALKSNRDENPSADKMVRFARDLAAADDSSFESVLEQWMDVDMLMNKMAVDRAIEHWDGIVAWYCYGGGCQNHNYYWYESTTRDEVWLIPWDLDRAMVMPPPIRTLYGVPDWDDAADCTPVQVLFPGLYALPPACEMFVGGMSRNLWARYVTATRSLLSSSFTDAEMASRVDAIEALISAAVDDDPWVNDSDWQIAVAKLRGDLVSMRLAIEAKVTN